MVLKKLTATAKDAWRRRQMPAQIASKDTRMGFAEIIGDESLKGQLIRTGPILELMDVLGGSIAMQVAYGPIATIMFDRVELIKPVYHRDLIRLEGEVINMSRSAITIQCCGFRHDLQTGDYERTHSAIVTFVAINRFGKTQKGLPTLFDAEEESREKQDAAQKRKELSARWRIVQDEVDNLPIIKASDLNLYEEKEEYVSVSDTEIEVRKRFLPKNLNVMNTLFGGDLLSWMDNAAIYCARHFTKNERMVTMSMNRVLFKLPILASNIVTVKARVANVRRTKLEVEVEVFVSTPGEPGMKKSHTGYFMVLNVDENENPLRIKKGLLIDETKQDDMRVMLKAQKRWQFEDEEKHLHLASIRPLEM
ncbi:Atp-binding protein [Globisporangium polare]